MAFQEVSEASGQALQDVRLRPFPQLARRKSLRLEPLQALYGRAMNNEACFRWMNRKFIREYARRAPPPLPVVGERIVRELRERGVALAQFSDFFEPSLLARLTAFFQARKQELDLARARRNKPLSGKEVYLDTVHKAHLFAPGDAASEYLSAPVFARIAADYMGMAPRFVGSSFWHTRKMPSEERVYSQLWHRDYNDRRLVKVFLYLTDVAAKNGMLEYVAGAHATGPLGRLFDRIGPDGLRVYPDPQGVERLVAGLPVVTANGLSNAPAPPFVLQCAAPAGTLIFADTFGLHRGGHVEEGWRDMVMLTYSTNFNVHKPHYSVSRAFAADLSPFLRLVFGID